jgi:opacity protein-like surface antigen
MSRQMQRRMAGVAALLAVAIGAAPAGAQTNGGDGFLFGQPSAQISVRAGYARPGASSDLFTESFDQFSLTKSSLASPDVGAELGVRLAPRLDFTLGVEYAGRATKSDYRYFYDNNQQPIEQTTTFNRVPVTAGLKAYLTPRGRAIGSLAWIPASVTPWVGAAAGATWYRFQQEGDFIGPPTPAGLPIYNDKLESSGWGFAMQGSGGVDVNVSARMAVTADARFTRSHAALDRDYFTGYQDLDLSGVSVALGLTFRL